MPRIHQDVIRQFFTLLLIVLMAILIFMGLAPYLSGVLGAITLYIIMKGWMRKLVQKGWKPALAASYLMLISFIGIIVPVALVILMLSSKVKGGLQKVESGIKVIKESIAAFENNLGYSYSSSVDSGKISGLISDNFQDIIGDTFNIFIAITIMYFLLYYMLVNRKKFIESLFTYLPMRPENINILGKEIGSIVKSNAIGIPLVAILQGFVALIAFLALGVPNPWFWFVITTVGSVIPFIGTAIGIVPVVFLLFSKGHDWEAIVMLFYGVLVVGTTDNLFRLVVQKKLADIHPLITLIGVIIGVPIFGFIGLIFGPLLLSLFLLILRIYKKEYGESIHVD